MCSTNTNNEIINVEDLYNSDNFQKVCDINFDLYKQINIALYTWLQEQKTVYDKFGYNSYLDINYFRKDFENALNRESRRLKVYVKKSILLNNYEKITNNKEIPDDPLFRLLLQKRPSRNISGITSVTVLTSPHPNGQSYSCKHNCYYCPNEPAHAENNWQDQPRSYLYHEPAVKRANENRFEAIAQMIDRLNVLMRNGHEIDKLEIIIEGGTYTEYPVDYLEEFHRDLFYSANTYFDIKPKRDPLPIDKEIAINTTTKVHIIGICIETRPDAMDTDWIKRFRKWGITRIQLGVQHTDNTILKKINRGHTIEQALQAIEYLKDNCFKIDIHIMPDLPFSSKTIDLEMFDFIYKTVCPDQMKIYPCEVTPWTVIKKWYDDGKFIPYFETNPRDLLDVIKYAMKNCPNYIRLPRVIRDIPISYIHSGNTYANLRQMLDIELEKEDTMCGDIRTHEIGRHSKYYNLPASYNIYKNKANNGTDYFISYESRDKVALFGFIRLRFSNSDKNKEFNVLKERALIRELHVYGNTNSVKTDKDKDKDKDKEKDKDKDKQKTTFKGAQHKGIGKNLLKIAEKISLQHAYKGIVVISGEGVKNYYKNNGYYERETFMVKDFSLFYHYIYKIYNMLWMCIDTIIDTIINR